MTWWQWVLSYAAIGVVGGAVVLRLMWAAEYKAGKDSGEWTDEYYGLWGICAAAWPLIGPIGVLYWLHEQGVFKAILTPTAIKKAKK